MMIRGEEEEPAPGSLFRLYIGFDDTDSSDSPMGTGRLARYFADRLPDGCRLWGAVRQQLLVDPRIPYTSHNSSACLVLEVPDRSLMKPLLSRAEAHIRDSAVAGSDPGLCLAWGEERDLARLGRFGSACAERIVTQAEAREAASGIYLEAHGGNGDGIIGAAAAVGLTAAGWSGRLIEYGRLRDLPHDLSVDDLDRLGMKVVSLDRDAAIPGPDHRVQTRGWLRPRLWGGRAVVPVMPVGDRRWVVLGKRKRRTTEEKDRINAGEPTPGSHDGGEEQGDGGKNLLSGTP